MKFVKRTQLKKKHRINDEITSHEIRLISVKNDLVGIVTLTQALQDAKKLNLDLVEISATARPPVCRIMDYGKFLYKKSKNIKEQKKKQKVIQIKEVKFRPSTDNHDYQVKLKNLMRFLNSHHKVKITVRFRGREMAHQDIGIMMLKRIQEDLKKISIVEFFPLKIEGRQMIMILSPKKK